jgi:hypothetical protein
MAAPFIGSEALRAGRLTRHTLRTRFVAIYPDVYVPAGAELTPIARAKAAWLWTRGEGVVAGQSAAAWHRAKWVSAAQPAEVLWHNRRAPRALRVWSDQIADDEVEVIRGVRVTTAARTALDIASRYLQGVPLDPVAPLDTFKVVAPIDSLARATGLTMADVESLADRYRGRRGIRHARQVLDLVDSGAESPQETRVRLLVIGHGFPAPQTQIPVYDEFGVLVAVLDMGWEDVKIAIDYEGEHHRRTRREFNKGIRRHDAVTELGWTDIRVTVGDTDGGIIARLKQAWERRVCAQGGNPAGISPWAHAG